MFIKSNDLEPSEVTKIIFYPGNSNIHYFLRITLALKGA
jgi:hypothetical protein